METINKSEIFFNTKILVPLHAELLHLVRDHVHYIPTEWLKDPRSSKSQKYFSQLFQVFDKIDIYKYK